MFEVLKRLVLAEGIVRISFSAPAIARRRKPGQFIIIRVHEGGERIPLTIVGSDPKAGSVDIIVQAIGKNTTLLCSLNVGEKILDVVGPLGTPTHLEKFGTCVVIGGGVGVAPLLPIAQGLKDAGNRLISILGARNKELIILEKEFTAISDDVRCITDDGSSGKKGFVTDELRELIANGEHVDFVIAVGPVVMMEAVAILTKERGIKTMVSLNPIMIDGTGMCGGCRCIVNGKTKFACVDGPEFDGHEVDFENLKRRLTMFKDQERHVIGEGECRANG